MARPIWASISDYEPPPLDVLRNPWVQWTVVLPREIDGPEYDGIKQIGPAALAALGVRDAFSHMEWFERPDGSVAVSEVGARPPGAQLASMIGFAHDMDFYSVWAELVILGQLQPAAPSVRHRVRRTSGDRAGAWSARVHGLEEMQREIGHLVVDAKLPRPGQPASTSYEGEGFVTVRHQETAVVQDALRRILHGLRVELVEAQ